MKILIYSPKFYPSIGGLENLTLMLAREFQQKGHETIVITQENSNGTDCGVTTYYRPSLMKCISLFYWCDVFYMPNVSLKACWLMLFNPFKRWVVSHNGWYVRREGVTGWQDKLKLFIAGRTSANISVSNAVAEHLQTKSKVIYNCYEDHVFFTDTSVQRDKDVLFVGRLVSDKGADLLVEACIDLWKEGRSFGLTITGDGPERKKLEEIITAAGVSDRITFTGFKTGSDLNKVFNQHKIFVAPARWREPFGIVALEGLACGCRVLCSDGGGLPEAVGEFGTTFKRNSVNDLKIQLKKLLDREGTEIDAAGLRNFLAMKSPSKVADQYLAVFKGDK